MRWMQWAEPASFGFEPIVTIPALWLKLGTTARVFHLKWRRTSSSRFSRPRQSGKAPDLGWIRYSELSRNTAAIFRLFRNPETPAFKCGCRWLRQALRTPNLIEDPRRQSRTIAGLFTLHSRAVATGIMVGLWSEAGA